jgi:hypothetical protein
MDRLNEPGTGSISGSWAERGEFRYDARECIPAGTINPLASASGSDVTVFGARVILVRGDLSQPKNGQGFAAGLWGASQVAGERRRRDDAIEGLPRFSAGRCSVHSNPMRPRFPGPKSSNHDTWREVKGHAGACKGEHDTGREWHPDRTRPC